MSDSESIVKKLEETFAKFDTESKALIAYYAEPTSRKPEEFLSMVFRFAKEFEVSDLDLALYHY